VGCATSCGGFTCVEHVVLAVTLHASLRFFPEFKGDDAAYVAFLNVFGAGLHAVNKSLGVFLYPGSSARGGVSLFSAARTTRHSMQICLKLTILMVSPASTTG
jgi:hypothetical protein